MSIAESDLKHPITADALREMRELITPASHWSPHHVAVDAAGNVTVPSSPRAAAWNLLGANVRVSVSRTAMMEAGRRAWMLIMDACGAITSADLPRDHAAALALLDRLIARI